LKQIEKRVRALEAAVAPPHYEKLPEGRLGKIVTAQMLAFALRLGGNAKEELAEAGASLDAERHSTLTERLEGARRVAAALASSGPPLVAGTALGDLVAAVGPLKTKGTMT
jgi:hypothetical protein